MPGPDNEARDEHGMWTSGAGAQAKNTSSEANAASRTAKTAEEHDAAATLHKDASAKNSAAGNYVKAGAHDVKAEKHEVIARGKRQAVVEKLNKDLVKDGAMRGSASKINNDKNRQKGSIFSWGK